MPPTSGTITRTEFSGSPSVSAIWLRVICGPCVLVHSVNPSVSESGAASTARPSIGTPDRRWLFMRWRTNRPAPANAASAPSVLRVQTCSTLLSSSSYTLGAPDSIAFCISPTAGSGSQSTTTSATASTAISGVLAITAATASPT